METCQFCKQEYLDYYQHVREEHPINCKEARRKALAYAQGKLSELDDDRIEFHLRACKLCLVVAERIWKKNQI